MAFLDNAGLEYLLSYITLSDSNLQYGIEELKNSIPDVWSVDRGGTGANNGIDALLNLGIKMSGRTADWNGSASGYATYRSGALVKVSDLPPEINASFTLSDIRQYFDGLTITAHVEDGTEKTAVLGSDNNIFYEGAKSGIYLLGTSLSLVYIFVNNVVMDDGEEVPSGIYFADYTSMIPGFYVSSMQLERPRVSVESGGTGATAAGTTLLSNIGITSGTADAPATGIPGTIYIQYSA